MKLLLALFLALSGVADAPQPPENVFAAAWNSWIALRAQDTPGIINAQELHAWKRVEEAWKDVKRAENSRH